MKDLLGLTKFYYEYVSCDHHKDRDCHFSINKVWSYRNKPHYRVEHYGYMKKLNDDTLYECYDDAYHALYKWLREELIDMVEHFEPIDNYDDWDYNVKGVQEVIKKYKHLLE